MSGWEPGDNPLDEYAARASRELASQNTDVNNASVERVESGQVSLRESFVQHVQASATYMEDAAAGVVKTNSLDARDVSIGVAMANTVQTDTLHAGVLAANQLEGQEVWTGLLFAFHVRGNIHSTVSPLAGLAIGAGFATMLVLMRLVFGLARRRHPKS
ncbi:MAG: hypothetical protein ACK4SA_04240 [Caldilinea sp.]